MRTLKSLLPALVIASLLSSLSYAAAPDRISGALTGGQTVPLRGNVHHKALPQYDQGPDHPDVAETLGNLSIVYADLGRYADAEALAKRALAIREKAFGAEHPIVATS